MLKSKCRIFSIVTAIILMLTCLSACAGGFAIEGKWKNVGDTGYGQAQPGAIVVFDGTSCNYYSPRDTYTCYKDGDSYQLDLTSLMGESQSFSVNVIDNDNIEIGTGSSKTILKRVE